MIGWSPQEFAANAKAAEQRGDKAGALTMLAQAVKAHPKDARLWHYSASLMLQTGNAQGAADNFARAFALLPSNVNFAVDQAIALSAANKHAEALELLAKIEKAASGLAPYWSTRANAARGTGDLAKSAEWYDRALALEPRRPKALQGRASVALERGEADAAARFDQALLADQSNAQLWLGKAQALDVEGRWDEARQIAEALVTKFPQWLDSLRLLAQLRMGAGDPEFDAPFHDAAKRAPGDPAIPGEHCRQLAALDMAEKATDVAADARKRFPDNPHLAMLEAIEAGASGQTERAEAIWANLEYDRVDRFVFEARHRVRCHQFDRADELVGKALAHSPWDIGAWALQDLIWRVSGDERHEWLHGQQGLVQFIPLDQADEVMPAAIETLHDLHENSHHPLAQSLRGGGTQTRGRLFDRHEPELQAFHRAILNTLVAYRSALPPRDETHPLLRSRDAGWSIGGSWSIRFVGEGGHHKAHLHPEGLISSACYLVLPDDLGTGGDSRSGWIELGRPPPDFGLDLEPLHAFQPKVGHLALFPSTMYHATRSFKRGRRMTAAFDVEVMAEPA